MCVLMCKPEFQEQKNPIYNAEVSKTPVSNMKHFVLTG